jgi:hypothetical protein
MIRTSTRKVTTTLAAVAVSAALGSAMPANPAAAAQLSQLDYQSTGLDGHPDLADGGALDVTLGRRNGARELHRVVGAAPSTSYIVSADIYFATPCQPSDPYGPVTIDEGTLDTNPARNGTFVARFPGDAFATAPDEFWVRWQLRVGDQPAYETSCAHIILGP